MRKLTAIAAMAALAGCVGVGPGDMAAHVRGDIRSGIEPILIAEPRPVLSGREDDEEPFIMFGARGGVVLYAGGDEVAPRLTVGAYGRMLETEEGRLEVAIEITPDVENIERQNLYVPFSADYVGFISDLLYWKAGGYYVLEMQGEKTFGVIGLEGGMGLWFPVGGEEAEEVGTAAVVNFMLHLNVAAMGGDVNAPMMLSITGGYEF